ncbi:MAG: translation initiation factor IF-2 [Chloroflexi bacterium]|nr:MAG: translation initiation factor IF-2 [Chloroflexota bacterium]
MAEPAVKEREPIEIPPMISVRELSETMGVSPIDLIKTLMANGIMANINQTIDFETAAIVAEDMGYQLVLEGTLAEPEVEEAEVAPEAEAVVEVEAEEVPRRQMFVEPGEPVEPRPPIVTVLGHVDHGKTTLLDTIRHTNVAGGEAGGITQHIGAYQVEQQGRKITFIDTPGHEAFTAMRARGAQVTDIAVLVVAADDGVMPQTLEAIDHARAAGVPIVVALNKVDLPTAQPERVMQQLADHGLVPDAWGGDTFVVPISALRGTGIPELLDAILLVAETVEPVANPNKPAAGTVLEGKLDRTRGPVATLLVQAGTLHVGDTVLAGTAYGRIRAMFDEHGKPVKEAGPSMPVEVLGLSEVPAAGEIFETVEDERTARSIAEERRLAESTGVRRTTPTTLDELFARMQAGETKQLNLIVKADVQGSLEPIRSQLERLGTDELKVNILHMGTGAITENDIMLASASDAVVIGFNVPVDSVAERQAEIEGVEIRLYKVIYKMTEDIQKALEGLLEPEYEEVLIGQAEVRAVFSIPRVGKVAGCYVTDGKVKRGAIARLFRNGDMIYEGEVASLKRFTEDVREVVQGYECGLDLTYYDDYEEGDIIRVYEERRVR